MDNHSKLQYLTDYLKEDILNRINYYRNIDENSLIEESEKNVLLNYHKYAPKIKAYVKFLKEYSINIDNIKDINDFKKLPLTTKDNYISKYKFEELVTDISYITSITSSTGSTGNAFYWPKGLQKDINIATEYELLFELNFGIKNKKTLCIISLGLGVWNAGNITIQSSQLISEKGYDFSFITPGISIDENIKILERLINSDYDQFIIVGYPSFIKDILEEATIKGINIKDKDIFILTGGETITEEWREYIYDLLGKKNNNKRVSSLIGTSEGGVIAIETEFINFIKKEILNNEALLSKFFHVNFVPTLMQYDPQINYLEEINSSIILSNFDIFSLIRYDTKDSGGIFLKDDLIKLFNIKIPQSINILNLPIIYIKGRSDVALTLYAVNIYIDHLKQITYSKDLLSLITGRFQSYIEYDNRQNQKFYLKLECNKHVILSNEKKEYIRNYVVDKLRKLNSEYNKLYESVGDKVAPIIEFEEYSTNNIFSHDKPKYKKIV